MEKSSKINLNLNPFWNLWSSIKKIWKKQYKHHYTMGREIFFGIKNDPKKGLIGSKKLRSKFILKWPALCTEPVLGDCGMTENGPGLFCSTSIRFSLSTLKKENKLDLSFFVCGLQHAGSSIRGPNLNNSAESLKLTINVISPFQNWRKPRKFLPLGNMWISAWKHYISIYR